MCYKIYRQTYQSTASRAHSSNPFGNQGFLVPDETKEGERFLEYLNQSPNQKGGEVSVTLLTNLQSVARWHADTAISRERTSGDVWREIFRTNVSHLSKDQCEKVEAERLFISYYGSEPLSNPEGNRLNCNRTKAVLRGKWESPSVLGMVTSGVLLTRAVVETLRPLGFVQVQITVDGNQQTHDASRPFQSGKGTYATIMKNLAEYAGLIRTDVLCVSWINRASMPHTS